MSLKFDILENLDQISPSSLGCVDDYREKFFLKKTLFWDPQKLLRHTMHNKHICFKARFFELEGKVDLWW